MKPWRLTAGELAASYKARELDPVETVKACLGRLEEVNPTLNAVVTCDSEGALEAARNSRERWKAGVALSALDGVPVTVKDNLYVKGMRATWGSAAFADFIPDEDDLPVSKLREAGAIILAKTNTPEFALAGHTNNLVFGSTGNPWAPDLSPGGSSGGAASGLMAGVAPLALGTDAGGSTRRPACHCGCVGLRTSIGAIPRRYGFPPLANDFQTVGILARSAPDARLILDCIGAPEWPKTQTRTELKIAAICEIGDHPIDPEIRQAFQLFKESIAALGTTVVDADSPFDPDDAGALFMDIASVGVARVLDSLGSDADKLGEAISSIGAQGRMKSATDYARALDAVTAFRWKLSDFFDIWDFMIMPTAAALPWPRTEPAPRIIDGQAAGPRASAIYTTFANVAGLPGINVPFAESADGLPIGIQIVGPMGSDYALIDLAEQLEADVKRPLLIL